MRLTKPITKEILKNAEEIIIYGAGNCGEIVMRGLEKWGYKVGFFCDQKEHLKTKWGVEVIRPAELPKHKTAHVQ